MTEQAAFKLNRARALVRETQQWAARAGKTLLAVDLCQIEGRLGTAMEQYHVVLPPRQTAARTRAGSQNGNGARKPWYGPRQSQSHESPAGSRPSQSEGNRRNAPPLPTKNGGSQASPVSLIPRAPTAPRAMLLPAATNLPPQELLIDFTEVTEDVAVAGFARTVEKNESPDNTPVPMRVSLPFQPESDSLISFDSDSDTHSESNIKSNNSKVPALSATAPVFMPMAVSGAISGILLSFDEDVEVVPVTVASVLASSDQDLDRDLQPEDQVVEVDLAAATSVTSMASSQSANENKVSQLKDQKIVAVSPQSVNSSGASDSMEVDSTGISMDAEPSGAEPSLHYDNDGPDSHKHARLVDDRSAVLVPVDVSPLIVTPRVVDDLDRTMYCVQKLRMLLEKHLLETTIRV
ncbi:hypothetical protein N7499_006636 [Penicillium canescens]|nr:hypothetical protein N7499_006636 [Penicillium canescens]KAJ6176437.1 hypothetical protein N7485_003351 [Penicillium canescens]